MATPPARKITLYIWEQGKARCGIASKVLKKKSTGITLLAREVGFAKLTTSQPPVQNYSHVSMKESDAGTGARTAMGEKGVHLMGVTGTPERRGAGLKATTRDINTVKKEQQLGSSNSSS